ncbi:MAG: DUF4339 domain-containing protein [Polyangiaceae bacterium]|nr:DUF4339 domain-containing protein [Polyangiaceae bacterium]
MAAKLKGDSLNVQGPDRWYVTDGLNAVGPVRRDLLVRGVEAGRVPLDTFIRHEGWKVWRPLADFAEPSGPGSPRSQAAPLSALLDEPDDAPETAEAEPLDADELDAVSIVDEKSGELGDRPTIEVLSAAVASFAAPSSSGSAPQASTTEGNEVPTQVSRDLLGGDRPTLASYLDDDEDTKVPNKPPVSAPPRVPSVPPPAALNQGSARPPQPASVRPLPPGSVRPPAVSSVRPAPPGSTRAPSVPPASSLPRPVSHRPSAVGAGAAIGPSAPTSSFPSPEEELRGAADVAEAFNLLLAALVRRTGAQVGLVHRMADEGATVVVAHGPNMFELLGTRTRLLDPAVVAAAGGNVVIAEPAAGPAGEATLVRMRKSGLDPEASAMFPIRPRDRLLGIVEIGKARRFTMRELTRAEDLVATFVKQAEAGGWS